MNTSSGVKTASWNLIATDYDNWMVTHYCRDMMWDGMHWETWSINAKGSTTLSAEHVAAAEAEIYAKVPNTDINWLTKHETAHWWCTYDWTMA